MTDDDIERVARAMCGNLGLDPEARVGGGAYEDDTPAERAARSNDTFVPDIYIYYPQWRLYRGKAAEAIAAQAAVAP